MSHTPSIFECDWEEGHGLDHYLMEWESCIASDAFNPTVLEMSQALYSAFAELRKIRKILPEGRPGIDHSFYQVRFELFAHNHFLSIAATRVVKILQIGWPSIATEVIAAYGPLVERVTRYRNQLEHQTEIGMQKVPPTFINNLDSKGYASAGSMVAYAELEELLNYVMGRVEAITRLRQPPTEPGAAPDISRSRKTASGQG